MRGRFVIGVEQQRDVIQTAVRATRTKAEACVERNGGHIEGHGLILDSLFSKTVFFHMQKCEQKLNNRIVFTDIFTF